VPSGVLFSFGPFRLDSRARRLFREREPIAISDRHLEITGEALIGAPPGSAGWILPVEPLLQVAARPNLWRPVLASLRNRAS
jgi:hypothetical protein